MRRLIESLAVAWQHVHLCLQTNPLQDRLYIGFLWVPYNQAGNFWKLTSLGKYTTVSVLHLCAGPHCKLSIWEHLERLDVPWTLGLCWSESWHPGINFHRCVCAQTGWTDESPGHYNNGDTLSTSVCWAAETFQISLPVLILHTE